MALSSDNNSIKSKGCIHLFIFLKNYSSRCREKDLEGHISSVNALIIIVVLLILICIYFAMNIYSFGHKKTNNNDLTYMWNLIKAELIETESRMMAARGWEVGVMGQRLSKGTTRYKMNKF